MVSYRYTLAVIYKKPSARGLTYCILSRNAPKAVPSVFLSVGQTFQFYEMLYQFAVIIVVFGTELVP